MTQRHFSDLLSSWDAHLIKQHDYVETSISIDKNDAAKLKALATIYKLPKNKIIAELIHQALSELEEQMPYIPGNKVIREEEGEKVFEDIGPMSKYLAEKKRVTNEY
jgi:hypothetical protein